MALHDACSRSVYRTISNLGQVDVPDQWADKPLQ